MRRFRYFSVAAFTLALAGCNTVAPAVSTGPTDSDRALMQSAKKPTSQAAAEKAVRSYFEKTLKDPESARYTYMPMQNGYVDLGGPLTSGKREVGWFVCGTVNAKNSYGGYVGQRVFMTHFNRITVDSVDDGAIDSGEYSIVSRWCQSLYGRAL